MLMYPQNNQQPEQPAFGQPTAQNPYQMPVPGNQKKKVFLMIGGGLLVLVLLLFVVFGGKSTPGQENMTTVMQNTSESLGILDSYQEDVQFSGTKNDLALARIILRGSYQDLNELYKKAYKSKKSFSSSPKPDETSQELLDEAARDNQLDTELIDVLEEKIFAARKALQNQENNFSQASSKETVKKSQQDLATIAEILADQQ